MDLFERYTAIVEMKENRFKLREIGERFHISAERVRQILKGDKPKRCFAFAARYPVLRQFSGRERVRMFVRIRDKFTCQDCGKIRTIEQAKKDGKKMFDVHHINGLCGKRSRGYDKFAEIGGLVTLCHKCHFNRHDHVFNWYGSRRRGRSKK